MCVDWQRHNVGKVRVLEHEKNMYIYRRWVWRIGTLRTHGPPEQSYLFAILPDIVKFSDPIAHVIDVNNNGIIKHLSIL